jgi:outer membrane protein OmpA-like peptidoglycan-associated protein/tetratricopeptide (TPR) repeat protein
MRRKLLLLSMISVFLSLGTVNVQAGPKEDPAAKLPFKKKMKWADNLFKAGSFYTAEEYYFQLKKEQPRNPYVTYMLAECFAETRDYPPAAEYYAQAFALAPEKYQEAPYKEGKMRKQNGEYSTAIERFEYYIKNYHGKNKKMKLYAKREIDGCKMAINSLNDPGRAFVKNAGPNVNTVNTELSPMPLGDSALLFGTMNISKVAEVGKDKRKDYVSRLMWSPKEFDRTRIKDSFEVALKFEDGRFNDTKYHIGNGSWSPGGTRFYFTKCREEDSMNIKCQIWVSEIGYDKKTGKDRGSWSAPKLMDVYINDPESSNTNPYCAMIGKKEVLFFASNRKLQSAGGFDIWYSVYDSARATYRRPQNCGKKVNSWGDDITPYYDTRRGKLYFASNGWANLGGFDIFSADGGPSRYSNLLNLGFPINSAADDLYYVQDPGAKDNAYVVSNRLGSLYQKNPTCCDDIWRVIKEPNFYVKGQVIDEVTNQPIPQVVIKMADENTRAMKDTFYSKEGGFLFYTPLGNNYTITADKTDYISGRTTVSTSGKSVMDPDDTTTVTIYMRKITNDFEFHVQNVYYNFDKGDFQPDSYGSLDSLVKFMQDNPSVSVEIRSYTDGKGDDEYNNELSVKRAQAVMNYMATKGIDRGRMIARGEGKKNPIKPNTVNGEDNPTGRQYNRRTEFRIIGDIPEMRIIYDLNRPDYIDKSGEQRRQDQLRINNDVEDDGEPASGEIKTGSRVGGE